MLWFTLSALAGEGVPQDLRALIAPLGTDHLEKIETISFTFNVERDGKLARQRAWTWNPNTGAVVRTVDGVSLAFTMGKPQNEDEKKADAQFVNDSFWLAPQLHARWAGADLTLTDQGLQPLPNGVGAGRKIVMQYAPDSGGYTPGDAYDLFLDEGGRIVAWNYREHGAPEPSLTTSFTAYVDVGPLTFATDHVSPDGKLRIRFTDLRVATR